MSSVAVLCEYPTLLGGERSWLSTLPALREAGFTPVVAAPPSGPLADKLRSCGIRHLPWSVHDDCQRRAASALRGELKELLSDLQPLLVHANSLSMTRLAAPVVQELNLPGIGHLRDIVRLSGRAVGDVNRMPRLLAVSEATRQFHVAQGIDSSRVHVLYNGVDLAEFRERPRPVHVLRALGLPDGCLLAVAVGQVGLRKGTDVFVKLARCVLERRRDVHFLIVGERTSSKEEAVQLEADLRRRSTSPSCSGNVHFLGTRSDVADILAAADVVVHPARQEPLGRVLLESAASGKAIIATDVGGTREIFPPGSDSAVLVPPREPEDAAGSELLSATLELLHSPTRRSELGRAARKRAEEQFDARGAGANLVRHYLEAVFGSPT